MNKCFCDECERNRDLLYRREYSSPDDYRNQLQYTPNPNHIYSEIDDNFRSNPKERQRERQTMKGIPCDCHKCRESRGLNLTTELLPLDAQMPFQHNQIDLHSDLISSADGGLGIQDGGGSSSMINDLIVCTIL